MTEHERWTSSSQNAFNTNQVSKLFSSTLSALPVLLLLLAVTRAQRQPSFSSFSSLTKCDEQNYTIFLISVHTNVFVLRRSSKQEQKTLAAQAEPALHVKVREGFLETFHSWGGIAELNFSNRLFPSKRGRLASGFGLRLGSRNDHRTILNMQKFP